MADACAPWPLAALTVATGAALSTAGLIVLLRPVLARYALARPNARSSHRVPTPQGGGIAIVISVDLATTSAMLLCPGLAPWEALLVVLGVTTGLAIVGAADDIVVLAPLPRLACQLAAATGVVVALPDGWHIVAGLPGVVERAIVVLALVWFVNLVNFMDGIDWITVAEVVPVAGGIAAIAALHHAPPIALCVALAILGATLGFAPFNRPVAKLFLGDVGSLPLGLLLGWLLLLVAASGHLVAALLLPLYYLADATITLLRRIARHERVWEAHRTHFYQRATDRGFTVIDIVARVFTVNLALVMLALVSVEVVSWQAQVGTLVCGVLAVAWLLRALSKGRA